MGTTAHLLIIGPDAIGELEWAKTRLAAIETRWTRFSPTSELSRLNDKAGRTVMVSPDTYRLIDHAVAAWSRTGGRFDPTMLDALSSLGYDRNFTDMICPTGSAVTRRSPGSVAAIDLLPGINAVTMPAGVKLDPGGIGKGLAADIIVAELLSRGATSVMVNLGGDLRVAGIPPDGALNWSISVADPFDAAGELLRVEIPAGAVATSSRLERQWVDSQGNKLHHLLDPSTSRPIANDIASVTVIAGEAWWAEALTKAVFTAGVEAGLDQLVNASGVIVDRQGNRYATPDLEAALR